MQRFGIAVSPDLRIQFDIYRQSLRNYGKERGSASSQYSRELKAGIPKADYRRRFGFMFEFHGWAAVRYHTHDTDSARQDECWSAVEKHVRSLNAELVCTGRHNGCDSVFIAGQHNHRTDYVIDLFRWLAERAPGSYGLLYVRDDEDTSRGGDYSNEFRVWKLRRGVLSELTDPFLSPCIPTIEDMYDQSRED